MENDEALTTLCKASPQKRCRSAGEISFDFDAAGVRAVTHRGLRDRAQFSAAGLSRQNSLAVAEVGGSRDNM